MSGGGHPVHTVHFSTVKETVEVQSGRFEYLKQILTIGLAGIGGLAAIFTDEGKIPEDPYLVATIGVFGVAMLFTVIYAAMGISTYANLLGDVKDEADSPSDEHKERVKESTRGIVLHAQVSLVTASIAGLSLLVFAALRVFPLSPASSAASVVKARDFATKFAYAADKSKLTAEHFVCRDTEYDIIFGVEGSPAKYLVRIGRKSGEPLEALKVADRTLPAGGPGKPC
jgi:hypothetical protein